MDTPTLLQHINFEQFFAKFPDGIVITNLNGEILLVNQQIEKLFGYSKKELVGKTIETLIPARFASHPRHRKEFIANFRSRPMGEGLDLYALRRDGSEFPADIEINMIDTEAGKLVFAVIRDVTRREKLQVAVRESEALFHSMFAEHSAIMLLIEPDSGQIVNANESAQDFYGYSLEQLQSMTIQEINTLPPEEVAAHLQVVVSQQRKYFVFPHRLVNGEIRTVEIHSSLIIVGGNKLLFSIIHDITERQRIEEALRERERRYTALFDHSTDAVFILSLDGIHLDANQRAADILGYELEELMGKPLTETVVLQEYDKAADNLQALLSGQRLPIYERIFRKKDGSMLPVEINVTLVKDEQGQPLYIQSIVRNINERKQTEKELRESERYNRLLFWDSPIGLALTTMNGELIDVNPAYAKITGYTIEELYKLSYWDITPISYSQQEQEQLNHLKDIGHYGPYEKEYIHKDGHLVPVRLHGRIVERNNQTFIWSSVEDITERKRAEDELQKLNQELEERVKQRTRELEDSEARLHLFSESAGDTLWMMDMKGNFNYASPSIERIAGFTVEEYTRLNFAEIIVQPSLNIAMGIFQKLVQSAAKGEQYFLPERLELEHLRKDGSTYWADVVPSILYDDNKQPIGLMGVTRDITDYHKLQEKILENEARYRAVVEDQTEYISRWKPDGTLTFVNERYAGLLKKPANELIDSNFFSLVSKENAERIKKNIQKLSQSQPVISDDYLSHSDERKNQWYQWTERGFFDTDGNLTEIQSVGRDITVQKEAEEALFEQTNILKHSYSLTSTLRTIAAKIQSSLDVEQIYNTLEVELGRFGFKYYIGFLEPGTQDLILQHAALGSKALFAVEKIIGRSLRGYRIPIDYASPQVLKLIENGAPQYLHNTFELMKPSFPHIPDIVLKGLTNLVGFGPDIPVIFLSLLAEEKTMGILAVWGEDIREEDTSTFSIFAGQVASALKIAELYKQAQAANAAKTEFLSRMSHELRTPLNSILGFAQLLEISRKDPLTEGQNQRVHQIVEGGQHLLSLINEVLDISRIEANRLQVSPEPVRIRDAMLEVCEMARPIADTREIAVESPQEPDGNLYVLADQQRLKQVLLNLLSNAVKYNKHGGRVTITQEKRPGNRLRISVKDTGPGISAELQEKMFIPFERLGAENSEVEGTGLGLALSKRLIELMGGKIGVESAVGKGSTFWFELPITKDPMTYLVRKGKTGPLVGLPDSIYKILYIEDNLANFELVRQVLNEYPQIELIGETRAEPGIEVARQRRPDLILLDLHLPGMKGQEALQRLKSDEVTHTIPVVVLSADATPVRVRELLRIGAEAYMTKPLKVKDFIQLIDEMLKGKDIQNDYKSPQGF